MSAATRVDGERRMGTHIEASEKGDIWMGLGLGLGRSLIAVLKRRRHLDEGGLS